MLKANISIVLAGFLLSGCHSDAATSAETRHEGNSIDLGKVETARVEINMGAGELHVKSGTPKLLEAEFAYNVPEWKPVVDYRASESRGELTISQPKNSGNSFRNTVYTWDLKLNDQVPLDVTAKLGAGQANLELGHMNLQRVAVNMGAGELKVDLRGEPMRDYSVLINGGVGEATVYLPHDAAISATAIGGIGEIQTSGLEKRDGVWINPERLQAPVTVHLNVKGGIGQINLVR
jgi:hypothetical protein